MIRWLDSAGNAVDRVVVFKDTVSVTAGSVREVYVRPSDVRSVVAWHNFDGMGGCVVLLGVVGVDRPFEIHEPLADVLRKVGMAVDDGA